jgi:ubiquinone/menaquinone biosynthesis C-methylase UbiE
VLKTDSFDEAVGAGAMDLFESNAKSLVLMDISPSLLAGLRLRSPRTQVVSGDVRRLPLAGAACDGVVSLSTLDHFESRDEIRASLREINRVLQPGGHLWITLDNLANPVVWLRNHLSPGFRQKTGLTPYFVGATCGPRAFRRLLEESGFRVEEMRAILHAPRVLAMAACGALSRRSPGRLHETAMSFLLALEWLDCLPARWLTGHFIAAHAVKEGV